MNRLGHCWKGLAIWVRWGVVASPLWLSASLYSAFGFWSAWIVIPGVVMVVVYIFCTWADVGDFLRAHVRKM